MAAIDQPAGHALTIREAAAACRLSSRTIRRKLNAGTFPNAYKTAPRDAEHDGAWKIPVADLEHAGLQPTLVHPTVTNTSRTPIEREAGGPTVLELVRSDRFGRLRAELAEAVAAAEIALLRAEAERWRVLADERAAALDRADLALKALTTAMSSGALNAGPMNATPAHLAPVHPAPAHPGLAPTGAMPARAPQGDVVAVPPIVRAEAMRYTATLQALHELRRQQNRWWQFWR